MSASSPGPVRRFFRGAWRVVDVSRRVVLNVLFLILLAIVVVALIKAGPAPIAEKRASAQPARMTAWRWRYMSGLSHGG